MNTKIDSVKDRLEMFQKADKGEKPVCPKCGVGHIISMCNRRVYQCDNESCKISFSVYRKE